MNCILEEPKKSETVFHRKIFMPDIQFTDRKTTERNYPELKNEVYGGYYVINLRWCCIA